MKPDRTISIREFGSRFKDFAICEAFGLYFLAGAVWGLSKREWPIFMPPQIDIFWLLFTIFGETAGLYLGVLLLFVIGAGCCWAGVAIILKRRNA